MLKAGNMWFIRLLHLVFLMLLSVKNYAQVVYDGQPEDRPPMEAALRAINQRVYAIYGAYEHWGSGSTIFGATMEIPNLPGDGYLSYLSNESYCDVLTRALGIAEVQVAPGTYLWLDEDVIADQITYENGGPIFKYLAIESNDFQSMVTPQYAIARIKTLTAKMNCVPTGVNAKTGDSRSSYVDAFKLENNSSITLQDAVLLLADPDADPLTTVMDGQDGNYIVSRSIGHQLFWIESNATPIDVNQAAYVYGSAKHDYYNGTVSISVGYTKISQKYVVYAINNMRGSVRVYVRAIVPSWAMEAQECPIPTDGTYYLFDGGDVEKDKPFEGAKVFKPKVDGIPNFGLSYNKGNCAWYSAGAIGVMKFQYEDKGDSPPLPPPPEGCKFPAPAISGPPTPPLSIGPKDGFSPLGSVVELATGHYTHFAYDWSNVAPGLSCASCGGQSAGTVHGMPLLRIHKPGFFKFPSTLGNSTFYSFDVALLAYPGRDGWIVHDPAYHDFIYYNSHGVAALPEMPKIVFVDSDGNVVPKPITGGKAIVENMQGGKRTFETWTSTSVDPLAGFVPVGRMISEEDRSGNRWIYTYATEASSQTPYKRASCTDQYGRVFGFKYDAASGFDGGVAEVSLPGGLGIIQYRYSNRTLIEVRHPNGDVSTFSGWNPVSGGSIDDAAAEGVHRRKSVSLQSQGSLFSAQFDLLKALDVNVAPDILGTNCQLKGLLNGSGEVVMTRTEITTSAGFLVSSVLGSKNVRLTYDQRRFPVKSEVLNSGQWEVEEVYAHLPNTRRVTNLTNAKGHLIKREIAPEGWVNQEVNADGKVTAYARNEHGDPLVTTSSLNISTVRQYDPQGNILVQAEASGTSIERRTTWTYNPRGQPLTMTDALGNVTSYDYDANGYLVAEHLPNVAGQPEAVKRYVYNTAGQLVQSTDASGRTSSYSYDLRGRHVATTYADGTSETTTYGSGQDANLVVAKTNRNGVVTAYSYDAAGRQIAIVEGAGTPAAAVTTITYVPGTTLEASRTTDATITTTTYDAYERPVVTTVKPRSDLTLSTQTFYDAAGQVTKRVDPYGRCTYFTYDVCGRELRRVNELIPGAVTDAATIGTLARLNVANPAYTIQDQEWDSESQLLARVDGRGVRTTFTYDALGRMTSQVVGVGTSQEATTSWTYDALGHRLSETDPTGVTTNWTYDARGQEISRTEGVGTPIAATTNVLYTPTGKVASVTDALGRTTVSGYGVCCDRLVSVTDANGYKTAMTYDAVGNRLTVTDPNGLVTTTTYDALNRPATISNGAGEKTTVTYVNRATNLPTSGVTLPGITWSTLLTTLKLSGTARGSAVVTADPLGSKSVEVRDGMGRPVARINGLGQTTLISYDAVVGGLVETAITDATQAVTRSQADGAGLVRAQVDPQGSITTMTYDAAGNRISVRNAAQMGQDMTYDPLGRLVSMTEASGEKTIRTYDLSGRVLTQSNSLNQVTSTAYDLRGRKITETDPNGAATQFAYDAVGNLVSITDAEGGITRYRYDALNRLVREDFPGPSGGTRVYTYDAAGRLTGRSERLSATGGN